jgi:cytochrome c oxidase assembly protein subunit 15
MARSTDSISNMTASAGFHRFAMATVAMTVLLVWFGAATTTGQAGMAFVDWPLSSGSINPEGWLKILPYFLEHGHRLIASTVGMMTLTLFAWSYVRNGKQALEVLAVVVWLAGIVYAMTHAGAERESASRKAMFWWVASGGAVVILAWLIWSWRGRGWSLLAKLCALALIAVVGQAILGGMRVTEVSDTNAVMHACLAQAFFCLLLLIAWSSSASRRSRFEAELSPPKGSLQLLPLLLCASVYVQLILGALMRHFHRDGLADTGILTTGGGFFPPFDSPDTSILLVMFLHKYWAVVVLLASLSAALVARATLVNGHPLRRLLAVVAGLLLAQLTLGIAVIASGKSFWITNFHVVNGLAILALSFLAAVRALSKTSGPAAPLAATESLPVQAA